jgi:hypothetical protein
MGLDSRASEPITTNALTVRASPQVAWSLSCCLSLPKLAIETKLQELIVSNSSHSELAFMFREGSDTQGRETIDQQAAILYPWRNLP